MNFNRRGRWDDALFVIVLVVPAAVSTARYFESEREMTHIAQARHKATGVALATRSPAGPAQALALHSSTHQSAFAQD
ncbi:MAG TPA: hypothetical protein VH183_06170 [Burkholderiaceae bacterium]|jgi:hypothetical protein|nr:hypothetical protein [Burkholderiaceae bacterium]